MTIDYDKICFVAMPFNTKKVGDVDVDFDAIYRDILQPAVNATPLPEGGHLQAGRTDQDFFSGDIGHEMFQYLEHARLVLADISGTNPNVLYELGLRHRARESGTVILRQVDAPIPFDINHIKAFPYEYESESQAHTSRRFITQVLTETLLQSRLDSPTQIALRADKASTNRVPRAETLLMDAENALRHDDGATAMTKFYAALRLAPEDAETRVRLALLLKDAERWDEAVMHLREVTQRVPTYSDAQRELGARRTPNPIAKRTPNPIATAGIPKRRGTKYHVYDARCVSGRRFMGVPMGMGMGMGTNGRCAPDLWVSWIALDCLDCFLPSMFGI